MGVAEPEPTAATEPGPAAPDPRPAPRSLRKRLMHVVRRAHLYSGLFLLPWAVLYGATGFLFNHPTAFADAPTASFGPRELAGTPMAAVPRPAELAERVVAGLNDRAPDGTRYALVEPEKAKWAREFAFATVKAGDTEVSLLFDVSNPRGTVRSRPAPPPPRVEAPAPFAVGAAANAKGGPTRPKADGVPTAGRGGPLVLADPVHERVKAAVPVVLERTGFPAGEATVTSVPDLSFLMSDGAKTWRVTYNPMTGTVAGASADAVPPPDDLSTRRFLTRLHLAHGYPGGPNAKWFWAVVVDAMALVMVFWGASGLFMWWQLKAARAPGFVVLLFSAAAATALGFGMHDVLAPRG